MSAMVVLFMKMAAHLVSGFITLTLTNLKPTGKLLRKREENIMQITINLKEFTGTEAELDRLYNNTAYDETFWVRDRYENLHKVSLTWEQGRGNNYRFVKGDIFYYNSHDIIWPNDITHVEVL
ncbi:hypothetical protein [Escherichia phage UPEC07]|nr:hypothetical protein [Escherichia phage UPEC07]